MYTLNVKKISLHAKYKGSEKVHQLGGIGQIGGEVNMRGWRGEERPSGRFQLQMGDQQDTDVCLIACTNRTSIVRLSSSIVLSGLAIGKFD